MNRLILSGSTRKGQSVMKAHCSECGGIFVTTDRKVSECEACIAKKLSTIDITDLADWELSVEKELSEVAIGEFQQWAQRIVSKKP